MILHKLEKILGKRKQTRHKDYLEFNCPKCDPSNSGGLPKYNLSISLNKAIFNCWACHYSGTLSKLVREYGSQLDIDEILSELQLHRPTKSKLLNQRKDNEQSNIVSIANIRSLRREWPDSLHYYSAMSYLSSRCISNEIIENWDICYTEKGKNKFRILIFSKNSDGNINYCVARAFYESVKPKYMNISVPKHSIVFGEHKIDWNSEIIITEGVFDSIVLWNSVPLLGIASGREILLYKKLIYNIIQHKTKILLAFDADATNKMIEAYECLTSFDIDTKIINVPKEENDISNYNALCGKKKLIELLQTAHYPTLGELLCTK